MMFNSKIFFLILLITSYSFTAECPDRRCISTVSEEISIYSYGSSCPANPTEVQMPVPPLDSCGYNIIDGDSVLIKQNVTYEPEPTQSGSGCGVVNGSVVKNVSYYLKKTLTTCKLCDEPDTQLNIPTNKKVLFAFEPSDQSPGACPIYPTSETTRCDVLGGVPMGYKHDCCDFTVCVGDANTTLPTQDCNELDPSLTGGFPLFAEGLDEQACVNDVPVGDARWVMLDYGNTCCFKDDTNDTNNTLPCPDGSIDIGYGCEIDTDGDGVPDRTDPDIDGDGNPNTPEEQCNVQYGYEWAQLPNTNNFSCIPITDICSANEISVLENNEPICRCKVGYIRNSLTGLCEIDVNSASCPDQYNNKPLQGNEVTSDSCVSLVQANIVNGGGNGDFLPLPSPSTLGCCYFVSSSTDNNDTPNSNCDHDDTYVGSPPIPFVGIKNSPSGCAGWNLLSDCPDGDYACYNYPQSDANNSDDNTDDTSGDNNPDTNSSNDTNNTNGNDNNSSGDNFDTSDLLAKLADIEKSLNTDGSINTTLKGIDTKLNSIGGAIGDMNVNLGGKLDTLIDKTEKADISNKEVDYDNSSLEDAFSSAKQMLTNSLVSFESSASDIRNLFNGGHSPTVHASGNCILSFSTKNIGNASFDFSVLSQLRIPFQFFLNLFLLVFTIKFYMRIAVSLVSYITGGA